MWPKTLWIMLAATNTLGKPFVSLVRRPLLRQRSTVRQRRVGSYLRGQHRSRLRLLSTPRARGALPRHALRACRRAAGPSKMGAAITRVTTPDVEDLEIISGSPVWRTEESVSDEYSVESISREYSVWTTLSVNNRRHRLRRHRLSFAEREGGREGLRALLAGETRFDDKILKRIFKYLTHPHMPAKKTAEPWYVAMYRRLWGYERASLIDPDHEALREKGNTPIISNLPPAVNSKIQVHTYSAGACDDEAARKLAAELAADPAADALKEAYAREQAAVVGQPEWFDAVVLGCTRNGVLEDGVLEVCYESDGSLDYIKWPDEKADIKVVEAAAGPVGQEWCEVPMNSDYQRVAVACGKAFGDVFYPQLEPDEAHLKPIRYANLSYIHRKGNWKKNYPVELLPWPLPVHKNSGGRSLIQPFDPFAWRPDGVRTPGCSLHTYLDMCTIPLLGAGVLEETNWNTAFGSKPDETHEYEGPRHSRSFVVHGEIWDRLLDDPSIDERVRKCFKALPEGPPKELVRIALTLRSGTAESVGWCVCITGFKFAQFLAIEHYGIDVMDLRDALFWLNRTFGSTEVTCGEQGFVSTALEWYSFESRVVSIKNLYFDKECEQHLVADSPRKVASGVKIYEKRGDSVCCYECTGDLRHHSACESIWEYMVVLPVPSWAIEPNVGLASALGPPENNFTERLKRFGLDRSISVWPGDTCRNAFEKLRKRMGDRAYEKSESFFVVARHIISGQAGRRGVVIFNREKVVFASLSGPRDLYAFNYPLHLIDKPCLNRVRLAADGTPHWRYDRAVTGYQSVVYPFADWMFSRGVQAKHWLAPSNYTAHLRLLRVALDATNATIPPAFPEAGDYLKAERLAGRLTNQAFDYCTFHNAYREMKKHQPLIQLNGGASALCLGAPTPRELAEGAVIELAEDAALADLTETELRRVMARRGVGPPDDEGDDDAKIADASREAVQKLAAQWQKMVARTHTHPGAVACYSTKALPKELAHDFLDRAIEKLRTDSSATAQNRRNNAWRSLANVIGFAVNNKTDPRPGWKQDREAVSAALKDVTAADFLATEPMAEELES
mmetsp:Transcript_5307/g.15771  ORF Transcript_5307/g.15771 Transcript_5307/m.15771 type:complete len:1072 (+) Transcript_5307:245-3460(+)